MVHDPLLVFERNGKGMFVVWERRFKPLVRGT
jgi:hypothetical protein